MDKIKPEIRISAEKVKNEWKFAVADNGIGMDTKHQNRYLRYLKGLHTNDEYTGIGLSICQKIIESHGGRIWENQNQEKAQHSTSQYQSNE